MGVGHLRYADYEHCLQENDGRFVNVEPTPRPHRCNGMPMSNPLHRVPVKCGITR